MNIEILKKKIIDVHGIKPTIAYYYYLWNVIDYCGEKRVRQSFKSIKDCGNEVIIGDYSSTDKTKELAEKFGFKVVTVEKDSDFMFAESKVRNAVIFNSKSNFLVPLNINVEYPKGMTGFIKDWIEDNYIRLRWLKLRTMFEEKNGNVNKYYGFSTLFYRPYLLYARGYDERTSYATGSQMYGIMLLREIYKLKPSVAKLGMIHKYHNDIKLPMMRKIYPKTNRNSRGIHTRKTVGIMRENIQKSFKRGIKKVNNSYW